MKNRFGALLCALILFTGVQMTIAQDIPRPLTTITFPQDSLVSFSPDASRVMIIHPDHNLYIHDPISAESLLTITHNMDHPVNSISWNVDNTAALLITSKSIIWLDTETGDTKVVFLAPDDYEIVGADFFQDRAIVARVATTVGPSDLGDFETHVWDADTLQEILSLPVGDDCLLESPADPFSAEVIRFLRGHPAFLDWCFPHIEWSPDQTRYLRWNFWNSGDPMPIEIYDTASGEMQAAFSHCPIYDSDDQNCETTAYLESVLWSPDGTKIVSLPMNATDKVKVWDVRTGTVQDLSFPAASEDAALNGVGWNSNTQIAAWASNGHIFVWDVQTGDLRFDWFHAHNAATGARWLFDNKLVLTWGENVPWSLTAGEIWNAASGEKLALIPGTSVKDVVEDPANGFLYIIFRDHIDAFELSHLASVWDVDGAG
jgi:WD40 repeat protein